MGEVFIFLFDHIGGAALVLILGYAADQISTPALKAYIVDLVKRRTHKHLLRAANFFNFFLSGFIEPVFGKKALSFSFFIRSCVVTVILLVVVLCLQIILYGRQAFYQFRIVEYSNYVSALLLIFIILSNFLIDYISNAKSISLLRMAANSGRPSNVPLMFVADATLTISIFSFLFPFVLASGLLIEEQFRPSAQIKIAPVQEPLRALMAHRAEAATALSVSGRILTRGPCDAEI